MISLGRSGRSASTTRSRSWGAKLGITTEREASGGVDGAVDTWTEWKSFELPIYAAPLDEGSSRYHRSRPVGDGRQGSSALTVLPCSTSACVTCTRVERPSAVTRSRRAKVFPFHPAA